MLKKFLFLILSLSLGLSLCGVAFALDAQTAGPLSFYASEGDLQVVVKASHPGLATGKQPSVEWEPCSDPSDGFHLVWEDPSPGEQWEISEVTVSTMNEADLYKYDGGWGDPVDNPSIFSELPEDCFKAEGGIPGDDDDDDDDDIVNSWEVKVGPCDPCPPAPAVEIVPVENPCTDDYWTFKFDVESCDNLCSLEISFDLECDVCDGTEYGIWKLVDPGDPPCTPCEWEYIGGVYVKEDIGVCEPEYVCTLNWQLTSDDFDFCCGFEETIFGIGPAAPSYIEPDPGDNEGEIDGWGDWMIYLGQCNPESGDVMASFDIATQPDDGLEPGDAFYFTLEFGNPENICEVDLYLYLKDCSDEKGIWEFLDGAWEEFAGYFEWEAAGVLPWRVNGTDYYCRIHVFYPPVGEEPGVPIGDDDDDDDDGVYGVGTDEYFNPASPGGDDDDDSSSSGGGGCSVGSSLSALLLLIPVGWILYRKR